MISSSCTVYVGLAQARPNNMHDMRVAKKAVNLSDHVADRARTDHLWGKARSHPVVAGKGPPGQPQKLQQMQCAHELCY